MKVSAAEGDAKQSGLWGLCSRVPLIKFGKPWLAVSAKEYEYCGAWYSRSDVRDGRYDRRILDRRWPDAPITICVAGVSQSTDGIYNVDRTLFGKIRETQLPMFALLV
jgi:hypothetical protein